MIEEIEKPSKRKKTNYTSPIMAVALLLFVVGLAAHFMYQSSKLTDKIKEQQSIRIELKNDADKDFILQTLKAKDYTKLVSYVPKEQGWKEMKGEMQHDPSLLLDENPLPNIIILQVKAEKNTPFHIGLIKKEITQLDGVVAVEYKEADIKLIDKIISKLTLSGAILIVILFLIAVYIIASTIRLAIFSQRFIIRSMQLVGATRWFIIRPFIVKSLFNGLFSGLLASGMISGLYFLVEYYFPKWNVFHPLSYFIASLVMIVLLGILLSILSSWIMVRKYLRMKLDNLY